MKRNIAIVVLLIIIGLYFFDVIGSNEESPAVVNSNTIKFHTYSLHNIDGGLFKINHDTGEAYYFQSGMFIPVQTFTTQQIQQLQNGQQPMSHQNKTNQLLEQYD